MKQKELPLDAKLKITENRIKEWHDYWKGQVYVAFSGGKDSTVLLHIVRKLFHDVPAVFCNSGMEYPEIVDFVKTVDNVVWLKPRMTFKQVIEKYGFPIISKKVSMGISRYRNTKSNVQKNLRIYGGINPSSGKKQHPSVPKKWHFLLKAPFKISERCCDYIKKYPFLDYEKESKRKPYIGTMVIESQQRKLVWMKYGCNGFNMNHPKSTPLAMWNEDDIWQYIKNNNIKYSDIYNKGEKRTGCIFCMFGIARKGEGDRFERMKKNHNKLYRYCMEQLKLKDVLAFIENKGKEGDLTLF